MHPLAPSFVTAVRRLVCTHFRTYHEGVYHFDATPVVLTGENGAGKTNLLEALSFLSPGKGLRNALPPDIPTRDAAPDGVSRTTTDPTWSIAATVDTAYGTVDLGVGMQMTPQGVRRVAHANGAPLPSHTALTDWMQVLWLTPAMDPLFMGPASDRRRFLDRLVYAASPAHATHVLGYERAMRQRLHLLTQAQRTQRPYDAAWVSGLEAEMARLAVTITAAREAAILRLQEGIALLDPMFPRAALCLEGPIAPTYRAHGAETSAQEARDAWQQDRQRDGQLHRTQYGPHRADLRVVYVPNGCAARGCSTGQQKALLLSLVLGEMMQRCQYGRALPLLLLDEVVAHLDRIRRDALYTTLVHTGAQVWMTGTDDAVFAPLRGHAQYYCVEGSTLRQSVS